MINGEFELHRRKIEFEEEIKIPSDRPDLMLNILLPEVRERIEKHNLCAFYGEFGWAIANESGIGTARQIGISDICKEAYKKWVEGKDVETH